MPVSTAVDEVHDDTADFVYAVSLMAALEGAAGHQGHHVVLPFLGMARAELTDFGQRRPSHYVEIHVDDLHAGLADLEERLTTLLADSRLLQHSLRVDAARRLLRRGVAAVA